MADTAEKLPPTAKRRKITAPLGTANWTDMPLNIKEKIVKEMNLVTRTRLKMCSKSDKQLVESVPMHFKKVEYVTTAKPQNYHWSNVYFTADDLKMKKFGATFEIGRVRIYNRLEAYKAIQNCINNIIFKGNVEIDHLRIEALYPGTPFSSESLIKVKELEFDGKVHGWSEEWIEHCTDIEKLTVTCRQLHDLKGHSKISNVNHLKIYSSDMDAHTFLDLTADLKADIIELERCNTEAKAIQDKLKQWIDEDYPIGSRFETCHLMSDTFDFVWTWDDESSSDESSESSSVESSESSSDESPESSVEEPPPITIDEIVEGMENVEKNDQEESEVKYFICMKEKYMTFERQADFDCHIWIRITDTKPF